MGDMADMDRDRYEDFSYWYAQEGRAHFALEVEPPEAETEKAWLFYICIQDHNGADLGKSHWFPKSQCGYDPDEGKLTIPGWMLSRKGIEGAAPDYMDPEDYL